MVFLQEKGNADTKSMQQQKSITSLIFNPVVLSQGVQIGD